MSAVPSNHDNTLGRTFRWLLSASAMANLGDGISLAFLPLVAAGLAVSATEVAMIDGFRQLPLLFLAIPAGILLDRIDRRSCVAAINVLRGGLLVVLAWMLSEGHATLTIVAMFALIIGSLEAINDVAMPTVVPEIIEIKNLARANGLMSSVETTANYFVGRSLGASVASFFSMGASSLLAGSFYLLAAILWLPIQRVKSMSTSRHENGSIRSEIAAGMSYVWRHQNLRILAVMGGIGNFAFGAAFATLVLYVTNELAAPPSTFGILQGSFALGSILVGWQVSKLIGRLGEWRALALGVGIIPIAFLVTPLVPHVATVAITSLLNGAAAVVWNTVSISYRQRVTPAHLLGRATAVFRLISWGSMPLGALVAGPIADTWGLSAVYLVCAVIASLNFPMVFQIIKRSN